MKSYVLHTHACVYALVAPEKLGRAAARALRAVESGRAKSYVAAAVLVEIAPLHERGRESIRISEVRRAMTASPGFRFLPLDIAQIEEFAAHTQIRELFVRLILAAARTSGSMLICRDSLLENGGLVQTIWD